MFVIPALAMIEFWRPTVRTLARSGDLARTGGTDGDLRSKTSQGLETLREQGVETLREQGVRMETLREEDDYSRRITNKV